MRVLKLNQAGREARAILKELVHLPDDCFIVKDSVVHDLVGFNEPDIELEPSEISLYYDGVGELEIYPTITYKWGSTYIMIGLDGVDKTFNTASRQRGRIVRANGICYQGVL